MLTSRRTSNGIGMSMTYVFLFPWSVSISPSATCSQAFKESGRRLFFPPDSTQYFSVSLVNALDTPYPVCVIAKNFKTCTTRVELVIGGDVTKGKTWVGRAGRTCGRTE